MRLYQHVSTALYLFFLAFHIIVPVSFNFFLWFWTNELCLFIICYENGSNWMTVDTQGLSYFHIQCSFVCRFFLSNFCLFPIRYSSLVKKQTNNTQNVIVTLNLFIVFIHNIEHNRKRLNFMVSALYHQEWKQRAMRHMCAHPDTQLNRWSQFTTKQRTTSKWRKIKMTLITDIGEENSIDGKWINMFYIPRRKTKMASKWRKVNSGDWCAQCKSWATIR